MSEQDGIWPCAGGCRRVTQVSINGLCPECEETRLRQHDERMRTIHWRETGELLAAGAFLGRRRPTATGERGEDG